MHLCNRRMEPWRVWRPVLQILITVIKIWILGRRKLFLSLKALKGAAKTHPDGGLKMEPWRYLDQFWRFSSGFRIRSKSQIRSLVKANSLICISIMRKVESCCWSVRNTDLKLWLEQSLCCRKECASGRGCSDVHSRGQHCWEHWGWTLCLQVGY